METEELEMQLIDHCGQLNSKIFEKYWKAPPTSHHPSSPLPIPHHPSTPFPSSNTSPHLLLHSPSYTPSLIFPSPSYIASPSSTPSLIYPPPSSTASPAFYPIPIFYCISHILPHPSSSHHPSFIASPSSTPSPSSHRLSYIAFPFFYYIPYLLPLPPSSQHPSYIPYPPITSPSSIASPIFYTTHHLPIFRSPPHLLFHLECSPEPTEECPWLSSFPEGRASMVKEEPLPFPKSPKVTSWSSSRPLTPPNSRLMLSLDQS
ncbi:uncharacterized protein [Macrobrachium rosenbergii]|uniref:uncharacterized protein n=1 Tax=Macrobrachium rosenbergii TaxID=79674 RepID=UPI0034D59B72